MSSDDGMSYRKEMQKYADELQSGELMHASSTGAGEALYVMSTHRVTEPDRVLVRLCIREKLHLVDSTLTMLDALQGILNREFAPKEIIDVTQEFRPCPHCGGEAAWGYLGSDAVYGYVPDLEHWVGCVDCPALMRGADFEEARAAWNRRWPVGIARGRQIEAANDGLLSESQAARRLNRSVFWLRRLVAEGHLRAAATIISGDRKLPRYRPADLDRLLAEPPEMADGRGRRAFQVPAGFDYAAHGPLNYAALRDRVDGRGHEDAEPGEEERRLLDEALAELERFSPQMAFCVQLRCRGGRGDQVGLSYKAIGDLVGRSYEPVRRAEARGLRRIKVFLRAREAAGEERKECPDCGRRVARNHQTFRPHHAREGGKWCPGVGRLFETGEWAKPLEGE